ncbi:MAG: isoleucine--tRNA ligase [Candidatus Gygaella obscura]|nr:isoleucine--tRNA ligase [Candidatus Gygaella obscura]
MDYKKTLNLPKTKFPMKANLPISEPMILKHWQEIGIFSLISSKKNNSEKYILHDGPPYANGNIHLGHALNKILKDMIIKFKSMQGFDTYYVPGWDCHGLPIEHQLFKELGINKAEISQIKFRKKAYRFAEKFVNLQREQFKRLAVFADWDNPYLTMAPSYEESIITSFGKIAQKGYIYRGLKPVNWCKSCETALAEAEVEYKDVTSASIYVKFKLEDCDRFKDKTYLLIWTTTPWTLIANVAVAAHKDLVYVYVRLGDEYLVMAKDLLGSVLEKSGKTEYEVIEEFKGNELEGLGYAHPFINRKGKIVTADYVSKEDGSGLVHIAPGHGADDYLVGLKYKLNMIMPVDEKGCFDDSAGEFTGLSVNKANTAIIEKLKDEGYLLTSEEITHSYPHCWRCKQPIIFRATKQWFLSLEKDSLRQRLIEIVEKQVRWVPDSGKERIKSMLETRPDWCLSRQRYWGVPIPSLVCVKCKNEFLDEKFIEQFAKLVSKEGTDCWFQKELKDFMPKDTKCPCCGGQDLVKGTDILDVWFDSGVSHQAVLKKRAELGSTPCALYLEGSDQHRGWFQSSLIPSVCIDKIPPFKSVLTHGFVVDGHGRKMSKSLGNVISPFDIIKDYGVDILRLWVCSSDYNEDIRISAEIIKRLSEAYRKIRNTTRFILSNLYDFDFDKRNLDYRQFSKIDKWILFKLSYTINKVEAHYDTFEFHKAFKEIYNFCNIDLSMFYLDMVKGRLYTYANDSFKRRMTQTVIFEIVNSLLRLIAPVLSFTAEEIWQYIPKPTPEKEIKSIHLLDWPKEILGRKISEIARELKPLEEDLDVILRLLPDVALALEERRTVGAIGSSFDAKIKLLTNDEIRYKYLTSLSDGLSEIFKVSQVEIEKTSDDSDKLETLGKSSGFKDIVFVVDKADGKKCVRCWNYTLDIGNDAEHKEICANCINAIKKAEKNETI